MTSSRVLTINLSYHRHLAIGLTKTLDLRGVRQRLVYDTVLNPLIAEQRNKIACHSSRATGNDS